MKKVRFLPNLVTAIGLTCGLLIIFRMNMTEVGASTYSLLLSATILFIIAAIADLLDGAIARFIRAESEFGTQFDSLSDAITFGVAPSVMILKTLSLSPGSLLSFLAMAATLVYSACGVLRLVRFNVMAARARLVEDGSHGKQKNFTGLPIPGAAAAAISLNLFFASPDRELLFSSMSDAASDLILTLSLILLGYLMVCRLKFPSLKSIDFKIPPHHLVFITVLFAAFVLYGLLTHFALLALLVSWGYVAIALLLSFLRFMAGKKSKHLIDFEPEPDLEDSEEDDTHS